MTLIKTTLAALCFGLVSCNAATENTSTPVTDSNVSNPITIGETFKLASDITGQSHEINIWTPPEMGKDGATYPVLYVIDGGLDQDFQHIAGLAQLPVINNRYQIPIVVGIRTSDRFVQLTPRMTDARYVPLMEKYKLGGADDFHRMITEEVIPFVNEKVSESGERILLGESLAGFFVMREFLRYPDGFTHYISVSPSLWLDDQKLAKDAPDLLAQHDNTTRHLYTTMADEGGTMQAGLDKIFDAIDKADLENLQLTYVDRRNSESHSTIYHGATMDALTQMFGIPVPDYGPVPWYLREGGQPEEDKE